MITVYTTPTCGYCHALKAYLASKDIGFQEKDITMDQEAMQWVSDTVGQLATPVTDIMGEVILGFDRERIDQVLRSQKLIH